METARIFLTSAQRRLLHTVIDLYDTIDRPISAREIAKRLNKHPGSIRNRIPILTSLGLVESFPGPGGGYMPTKDAYKFRGTPVQIIV